MPADQARLTILVDLRADPIAGVLCDDGDRGLPFAGWMELTRAIESAREAARQRLGAPRELPGTSEDMS